MLRKVAVLLLFALAVVLLAGLLLAVDRAIKAIKSGQRRREAGRRLMAATAGAVVKYRQKTAAAEVSGALTSVIPAIGDLETRHVE